MAHITGNFSRGRRADRLEAVRDGDVIEGANLSQARPGTIIPQLAGKRIMLRGCNLTNVRPDPAWTIEGCNLAQREPDPEPTERQRLVAALARCEADRDAAAARAAAIQAQLDTLPVQEVRR